MGGFSRSLIGALLLVLYLALASGCLWVPAAAVIAVVASDSDSSSEGVIPPEPVQLEGAFLPLEGTPSWVAVGNFTNFPEEGGDPHLDVAVIAEDRPFVTVYAGDGKGGLSEALLVSLSWSAGDPRKLAVIPGAEDEPDGLLVATSSTLEVLGGDDNGNLAFLMAHPLEREDGWRDVVVGDFNGDGLADAAVSSEEAGSVTLFLGQEAAAGRLELQEAGALLANAPRALAAANFDLDDNGEGWSDLAILVEQHFKPTIQLLLSKGDGITFTLEDALEYPEADLDVSPSLWARDGVAFRPVGREAGADEHPDLVVARLSGLSKILIAEAVDPDRLELSEHNRPSGPPLRLFSGDPVVIHLPRSEEPEDCPWDILAVDPYRQTVALAYTEPNGLDVKDKRIYRVPGTPRTLASGDLNEDGYEDVVVVGAAPASLAVLLTNAAVEDVEDEPFFYPFSAIAGEPRPLRGSTERLVVGHAAEGGRDLFCATIIEGRHEVVVVDLDPLTDENILKESHFYPDHSIRNLVAADFDGVGGDEILVTPTTGEVFWLTISGDEFPLYSKAEQPLLDLRDVPGLPSQISGIGEVRYRAPTVASISADPDDPYPDILFPVTTSYREDWIAVILDPGDSPETVPDVRFYKTGDDPRRITVANINGDTYPNGQPVLDLLVACEGNEGEPGNRIDILLGDPENPGGFLTSDETGVPPLTGFKEGEEPEYAITDNEYLGMQDPARFVIVSNNTQVNIFERVGPVDFGEFKPLYEGDVGDDPEYLILHDFTDDGVDDPYLLIGDEDDDAIVFLRSGVGSDHTWKPSAVSVTGVAADQFQLLLLDRQVALACADDQGGINIYEIQGCSGECSPALRNSIQILENPRSGTPLGLAVAGCGDEGHVVATCLEDTDREHVRRRVDLLHVPQMSTLDDLRELDALSKDSRWRVLEHDLDIDALLLGSFSGEDAYRDLLVRCGVTGTVVCHDGLLKPFDQVSPFRDSTTEILRPLEREIYTGPSPLVGWESVALSSGGAAVLLVGTSSGVFLRESPYSEERILWKDDGIHGEVRRVTHGFSRGDSRQLADLYVAILTDSGLLVHVLSTGRTEALAVEVTGIIGCRDLDGDGRDDVVLIDPTTRTLDVFPAQAGGQFGPPRSFDYGNRVDPVDLTFCDVNGDERCDVAFGARDGRVFIFLGDGRFLDDDRSEVTPSVSYAGPGLEAIRAADLTGDDKDELIVSVEVPGLVILLDPTADRD